MPDAIPKVLPALCFRVADVRPGDRIMPGVKVIRCADCQAKLYASRATCALIASGRCRPVCCDCVPGRIVPVVTGEQMAEFAAWMNHDVSAN
jgi:hypothetical protein